MSETKTSTLTVTLTELRDLIAPVLPHADSGMTLPVLGCVEFRTEGEWLVATATDRYTIGVCRHKVAAGTEFACLVQAAELRSLLAMFKPGRYDGDKSVTLTIDGAMLRVSGASAMFAEATVSYNLYQGEYPRTRSILAEVNGECEASAPWGINGTFMTRFNHARRNPAQPVVLSRRKENRPMFVRVGDHFLGAIMPVRGGETDSSDWAAIFKAPEPESVPTAKRTSKRASKAKAREAVSA